MRDGLKSLIEAGKVIKPALVTGARNGVILVLQQSACMPDPDLLEEFREGLSRPAFKVPAKSRWRHMANGRHFLQPDIPAEVLHQELVNFAEPHDIFFIVAIPVRHACDAFKLFRPGQDIHRREEGQYLFEPVPWGDISQDARDVLMGIAEDPYPPGSLPDKALYGLYDRRFVGKVENEVRREIHYGSLGPALLFPAGIDVILPDMGQVGAHHHQVAVREVLDPVPDEPFTGSLLYPDKLTQLMKVERTVKMELVDFLDLNGALAFKRYIDQLGFHTACSLLAGGIQSLYEFTLN